MRLFSLVLLFSFHTALMAQNISDKLVAYFPFSACKANDESGNGSNGALIGDASCVCGVRDSAITMDGSGDAIFFVGPVNDVFSTSDFSVSFYFKPFEPGSGVSEVLFSKQENCTTQRAFWVRYNPKSKKISSGLSQNDTLLVSVTAALDPNSCWQYITLVRANTLYSIYVGGILRDSKSSAARIDLTSNAVLKVGEPICTLDESFTGIIDELRVYSRALKQEDIDVINLRADKILNGDTVIYLGNSLQIATSESCTDNFEWNPTDGVSDDMAANPLITPTLTTTYEVNFVYAGCTATDTIFVKVIDPDTLDCNQIFIPNAFTPYNSAGRNDVFGISNPYSVDEFISFEVFDRWGGRVFTAQTALDTWDGTAQGQPVNPGTFLYRLRYKCDGVEKVKAGNLTLLR